MSRTYFPVSAEKTGDAEIAAPTVMGASAITTSSGWLSFPLDGTAQQALYYNMIGRSISGSGVLAAAHSSLMIVGDIMLSAAPSSALGVFSATGQGARRYCQINTSRQMFFQDDSGNNVGSAITSQTIPTGTPGVDSGISFAICFYRMERQAASGTAGNIWVSVLLNGSWVYEFDSLLTAGEFLSGGATAMGEYTAAATTRGAKLYLRNVLTIIGDSKDDAPWNTPLPVPQTYFWTPNADGDLTQWDRSSGTSSYYTYVDDFPNNGATDYLDSSVAVGDPAEVILVKDSTTSNPFTSSETILTVQEVLVGLIGSAGKVFQKPQLRFGGNDDYFASDSFANLGWASPGTSFKGINAVMSRPGGGSWGYTDFDASDIQWGALGDDTGGAANSGRMTNCGLLAGYYTSTHPLAEGPPSLLRVHQGHRKLRVR